MPTEFLGIPGLMADAKLTLGDSAMAGTAGGRSTALAAASPLSQPTVQSLVRVAAGPTSSGGVPWKLRDELTP